MLLQVQVSRLLLLLLLLLLLRVAAPRPEAELQHGALVRRGLLAAQHLQKRFKMSWGPGGC